MAAKGTFGYFFALEKVSRRSGAKARIINFYYHSYKFGIWNLEFGIENWELRIEIFMLAEIDLFPQSPFRRETGASRIVMFKMVFY